LKMVTCWTTSVFKVWATFISKFGENSSEKGVSQTDFAHPSPRARRRAGAYLVGPAAVPPGTHAGAGQWPPVHGEPPRALCAYGRDTPPTPRPVTRGRRAHARRRTAIGHWPESHRTSSTASAPMPRFL
jgi:hypothetical protein